MFAMCPLVHNYSVITLDNWHLAYCDPTRSKITKRLTVNISLYNNKHPLHGTQTAS